MNEGPVHEKLFAHFEVIKVFTSDLRVHPDSHICVRREKKKSKAVTSLVLSFQTYVMAICPGNAATTRPLTPSIPKKAIPTFPRVRRWKVLRLRLERE